MHERRPVPLQLHGRFCRTGNEMVSRMGVFEGDAPAVCVAAGKEGHFDSELKREVHVSVSE